ncbi:MAG: Rrf2 family transcriptional regulator [Planctomycetota bacterium]
MLSTASEYALRSMCCLARNGGDAMTAEMIAGETDIGSEYLSKVLGQLARGGLVRSRRGRGGGFSLARSPEEISLLDIIDQVDPFPQFIESPASCDPCHHAEMCTLHAVLNDAIEAMRDRFAETSLQYVLDAVDLKKRVNGSMQTVPLRADGRFGSRQLARPPQPRPVR